MSKKKCVKKDSSKSSVDITALNYFLIYEASYIPQVLAWAKKVNKKFPTEDTPKDIIKETPQKYRRFIRGVKPSTYKDLLEVIKAASVDFQNLFNVYQEYSKEMLAAKKGLHSRDVVWSVDIDEKLRRAMLAMYLADKNDYDLTQEEGFEALASLYKTIIALTESRDTLNPELDSHNDDDDGDYRSRIKDAVKNHNKKLLTKMYNQCSLDVIARNIDSEYVWDLMHEFMVWNDVVFTDFWKTKIPKRDMAKIVNLVGEICPPDEDDIDMFETALQSSYKAIDNKLDELKEIAKTRESRISQHEFNSAIQNAFQTEEFQDVQCAYSQKAAKIAFPFIVIYKLIAMFKDARDIANSLYDKNCELEESLKQQKQINKKDFDNLLEKREKENSRKDTFLAEKKQAQLNELQLKYDRLLAQHQNLQEDNKFLNEALSDALDELDKIETESVGYDVSGEDDPIEDVPYPAKTVLFGGHPNWQRKFATKHPEVRIISGTKDFPENVVSPLTPLVLINTHHMCHKFFYKIRRLQQRQGWKMQQINPNQAANQK